MEAAWDAYKSARDRVYGDNRWSSSYIISNSIGQGEVAATPVQLANMTAAIANRGYYYTPHILKKVEGEDISMPEYVKPKYTTIDKEHFEPVIKGMSDVYKKGTARWVQIPGIEIAGKTGTVENYTKIDSVRVWQRHMRHEYAHGPQRHSPASAA